MSILGLAPSFNLYRTVLIDVIPGKEEDVYAALANVKAVRSRRLLPEKMLNADIIVLIEAADASAADRIATNELRGVHGVYSVRAIRPEHTIAPKLTKMVLEMEREATGAAKR